jgi:Family of unknown function (DUF6247)
VTGEPSHGELDLAERIQFTRASLPAEHRDAFETALRKATEQALRSGDYQPLTEVVEQWYGAALLERHGGESWQRQKRLIEQRRWDALAPGPGRPINEVIQELLR